MNDVQTVVLNESVPEAVGFVELWWPVVWPMLLALAVGVVFVWAWTVRRRRKWLSRAIRWAVGLYLLAGALGWGVFLSSEVGESHPGWFGWEAGETEETGEEVSP